MHNSLTSVLGQAFAGPELMPTCGRRLFVLLANDNTVYDWSIMPVCIGLSIAKSLSIPLKAAFISSPQRYRFLNSVIFSI